MEPHEGKKHNTTGKRENSYSVEVYNPAKRHRKDQKEQIRHQRHERSEGRNSWAGFEDSQNSGRTERSNSWSAYVDIQSFKSIKRRDSWSSNEDSQTHKRHDSYSSIRNNHNTRDIETDTTRSTHKAKQALRSPERYGSWPTSKDGRSRKRSDRGDSWSASEYNDTRRSSNKRDSWTSSKDRHTTRSSVGRDSWSPITDIKPTKRIERRDYNLSDNNRNSSSSRTLKRHSWPTSKDNQTSRRYDTANDREFEFFWKSHSPYSQWYLSNFTVDGITFNCTEQFMMYSKAKLFKDKETASEILAEHEPREHKRLGRQVKNFDQSTWDDNCMDIVIRGNKAKFEQNEDLMKTILKTFPKTLAEASPFDTIWGIGLSADDPRALNKETWKGKNLLGHALTKIRDRFVEKKEKVKRQKKKAEKKTAKQKE
ncbi:peptidyl-prolyl cis-trans isomerase G-like [Mytilus edulis]|uniref:peptidyl-prolyl cis-trans isomerase G-like n=1 Tax=Mytilus edulis TaxID=6550 RepID=UPI0039EEE7B0